MQERVERTYGFLTCANHAGIYVERLGTVELHFTIEEWLVKVGVNKQIFGELAALSCDFLSIPPL